ncbi:MAG TPA: SPOR domain-containing protein [Gemmatimonadota bacterium]|nr:SPOR domain-containing protein [Gemmatimonadota bacterium]
MRHESMRRIVRSAALAAALVFAFAGSMTAQDAGQLLERGKRAYEAGDFAAARTDLWAYLEATAGLSGPSRLPQADALYTIALMEPDAGMAAQHYRTIVEEYAASSVADEALFRLAQLDFVEGRNEEAREKLQQLSVDYPFSRYQAEVPLWTGKAWLAEQQFRRATDSFIEGFTRVKRQDLPQELSPAQREALGAEYVFQLARAFGEEGDQRTATQYYAMLALDYPEAPQAAEARLALDAGGAAEEEPVQLAEAPDEPREEPAAEEPAGEEEFEPPAGGAAVYVPDDVGAPAGEAPDVEIEDVGPREEPEDEEPEREEPMEEAPDVVIEEGVREPTYGEPPPVVIEEARPRPEPAREPVREEPAREQPAAAPAGSAWLQVGAFSSAANAADLSSRLKRDGFDSKVEVGIVDGQGYYRVRLGPYRLPAEAGRLDEARRRLEAQGYPARQVSE